MKITKKIVNKPNRNLYKLKLTFMQGDADGWSHGEILAEEITEEMTLVIKMLETVSKPYKKSGHSGQDCEDEQSAAAEFICDCPILRDIASNWDDTDLPNPLSREEIYDYAQDYLYGLGWESDPHMGIPNSFSSWEVTYFDDEGIEYEVED